MKNEKQKSLVKELTEKVVSDGHVEDVIVIGMNNSEGYFRVESTTQHYGFLHWVLNRVLFELILSEKQAQESANKGEKESSLENSLGM